MSRIPILWNSPKLKKKKIHLKNQKNYLSMHILQSTRTLKTRKSSKMNLDLWKKKLIAEKTQSIDVDENQPLQEQNNELKRQIMQLEKKDKKNQQVIYEMKVSIKILQELKIVFYNFIREINKKKNNEELFSSKVKDLLDIKQKKIEEQIKYIDQLNKQITTYSKIDQEIITLEQTYSSSLATIQSLIHQQNQKLNQIFNLVKTLVQSQEQLLKKKEIPLHLLVQHRQKQQTLNESYLLSSQRSSSANIVQDYINKNTNLMEDTILLVKKQLDRMADTYVQNLTQDFQNI